MVWKDKMEAHAENRWKNIFEESILRYSQENFPDWCIEVTDEFGLFTENSIYLHMISRHNIECSIVVMRRFLQRPAEKMFDVMTSNMVYNERVEIPTLSFQVSRMEIVGKKRHKVSAPYGEGVKITFKYFPRPINIVDEANGTMMVV